MATNRYEVVRQDNGPRLWYAWDCVNGEEVCDIFGNPVYYKTCDEAEQAVAELNAKAEQDFINRFEIRRESHGLLRWYIWDKEEDTDLRDEHDNTKYFFQRNEAEDYIQSLRG